MAGALVQVTKSADTNDGLSSTVATAAFGSNTTSGNAIVGHVFWQGSSTTDLSSVADSAGNSYTIVDRTEIVASGTFIATFFKVNITGGSSVVVTATFGTTRDFRRITAQEFSGIKNTTPQNANAINSSASFGTGTDAVTSGTDTSTATCMIWGVAHDQSATTIPSVGTGFTSSDSFTRSAGDGVRTEYKSSTASGTVAATFTTTGGTNNYGVAMLALEEAPSSFDVTPSSGSLAIGGVSPVVNLLGEYKAFPEAGSIAITGYAPRVELRQKVQPLIEVADATLSGSNTASSSWAVTHPAVSAGDLGIVYIAWDDSTNVTSVVPPTGPGGGTFTAYSTAPITDSATETRAKLWWYKANAAASASSVVFVPASGTESWSATWIRVPAGEFDPNTPIGSTMGLGSASTSAVTSPSVNAGVSDGQGTLLWFVSVDTDPMSASVATAGWTTLNTQDLGAVAHGVARRDAPVTDSAAYSAGAFVWNMAGTNQDTWTGILAIVRAPPVPEVVYPESGSLVIAGQVPTVEAGATGAYNANTLAGALTITGQVPTVTRDYLVTTGVGSIALTGVAPAVRRDFSVDTGVGSITITGVAPSADVGAVPVNVPTFAGSLVLSGQAPTVKRDYTVLTGVGSLTITGVAPDQTFETDPPGSGQIVLTGQVPTVAVSGTSVDVATFSGSLVISGQVPAVTRDFSVDTLAGSLTLTGVVPTVTSGDNPNVSTGVGSLVLTGVAPTITRDVTVETLAGALTISGQAPTLTRDYTVETLAGEITLAGYVPQVLEAGSWNITPPSGQIIYGGEPPQVVNSGDPLPSRQTGGGTRRRRYRKPYVVEIDGEDFVVSSPEQAEELLAKAQEAAQELLVDVRVQAKPAVPVQTPKAPRIRVKGPSGPDLTELVGMVAETREAIRELYLVARNAEIALLMRKIEEDDEDDALVALLLH